MSAGTITAKVVLDHPNQIHCGIADAVTGNVTLSYRLGIDHTGGGGGELFGPLRIKVKFHGRAKTKIWKSNGQHRSIYRGRAPLFSRTFLIYDAPFKIRPGEIKRFPFTLTFPDGTQGSTYHGDFGTDGRFKDEVKNALPPSFRMEYHGFAHRFDAFTEYRVGATVEVPRIDVKIAGLDEDLSEAYVMYEQPRAAHTPTTRQINTFRQMVTIQNEYLLPEEDRPSGFKQKTKALFKSDYYPVYLFEVHCGVPSHLFLGQSLSFEVGIKPFTERSTAVVTPDVTMSGFVASIQAETLVRAEKQIFSTPESEGNETVWTKGGVADSKGPFSKANDWTKTINTNELSGIPSTFTTYNISRRYSLKITFYITAANKTIEVQRDFPVMIHPPLETARVSSYPQAGPSGADPSAAPLESLDGLNEALPAYQPPPGYNEPAVDMKVPQGSFVTG